jgi:hypothetical protein
MFFHRFYKTIRGDVRTNVAPQGQKISIAFTPAAITAFAAISPVTTITAASASAAEIPPRTTITTASATTWATGTLFLGTGNINRQCAVIQLGTVHGLDGLLSFFRGGHGHKCETAGTARHAIHHQIGFQHRAVGGKGLLKIVFSSVEGNIPYKQFITHVERLFKNRFSDCSRKPGFKSSLNQVHLKIFHVRKALVIAQTKKPYRLH